MCIHGHLHVYTPRVLALMRRSIHSKTLWRKLFWTLDESRNQSSVPESFLPAIETKVTLPFLPTSELLMLTLHSNLFKSMFLVSHSHLVSFHSCSASGTTWFEHNHLRSFIFFPKHIFSVKLKSSPHTSLLFFSHFDLWPPCFIGNASPPPFTSQCPKFICSKSQIFHHFIQKYNSKYFRKGMFWNIILIIIPKLSNNSLQPYCLINYYFKGFLIVSELQ